MDEKRIKQIINLNKKFYQQMGKKFAETFNKPWKGWDRAVKHIKNDEMSVLDLGCGDGRFYEYLSQKFPDIKYVGLDINNDVLDVARKKYGNDKFFNIDVFSDLKEIQDKFDLIVAFGVTHHIPDKYFRKKWFLSLVDLLNRKGILVLTFWDFKDDPGNYLSDSLDRKDAIRFCHQYSGKELNKIIKRYEKANLKLLDQFREDNTNEYLVFGKL
ncbi:class I SAM-dependent methyltransferase [Patescibacteria group bacterium]